MWLEISNDDLLMKFKGFIICIFQSNWGKIYYASGKIESWWSQRWITKKLTDFELSTKLFKE